MGSDSGVVHSLTVHGSIASAGHRVLLWYHLRCAQFYAGLVDEDQYNITVRWLVFTGAVSHQQAGNRIFSELTLFWSPICKIRANLSANIDTAAVGINLISIFYLESRHTATIFYFWVNLSNSGKSYLDCKWFVR